MQTPISRVMEQLISLSEVAELALGNPRRTDLAAARCREQRVAILQRYRSRAGRTDPVLYIRLDDLPSLLGGNHWLMRDERGWRAALAEHRRRETRALKARVAKTAREARLRMHLEQVSNAVEAELADRRRSRWREPSYRR